TGLLPVRVLLAVHGAPDRLAVGDLRLSHVGLDLELTTHAINENLQGELTPARDNRLTGFVMGVSLEGRVLLGELLDGRAEFLLIALGPRLDRHIDDWRRER